MTISNLNVLQSGTVASVTPLNENFETIRVAVNTVEQSVTTNRTYLDNKVTQINSSIESSLKNSKTTGEVFCVNSGSTDSNGNPAILSYSGSTLSFSGSFIAKNINGDTLNATSVSNKSLSSYADGTYKVFIDLDKNVEIFSCTIYKSKSAPASPSINTIWLNTSKVPLEAKRYTASGWQDFLKIPVGTVTVSSGAITGVTTFSYNQNGYSVNKETCPFVVFSPDFSKGVNKTNGTSYTADNYGWLYVYYLGYAANASSKVTIDGIEFTVSYVQFAGSAYGCGEGMFIPINKGSTYSATGTTKYVFYPARVY